MNIIDHKQYLIDGGNADKIVSVALGAASISASTAIGGAIGGPIGAVIGAGVGAAANVAINENYQDIKKEFMNGSKIVGDHMLNGLPLAFG